MLMSPEQQGAMAAVWQAGRLLDPNAMLNPNNFRTDAQPGESRSKHAIKQVSMHYMHHPARIFMSALLKSYKTLRTTFSGQAYP